MDPRFQKTTFIPQKPVVPGITRITHTAATYRKKLPDIISVAGVIIFITAIVAGALAFSYKSYLDNHIQTLDQELSTLQTSFESDQINNLIGLDNRLKAGKNLLSQHLSVSAFFELLQSLTVQSVQFTDFNYKILPENGNVAVFMRGKARNYTTLVLQSDIFTQNKSVKRSEFSNLDLDSDGNVTFRVNLVFDARDLLYKDTFETLSLEGFPY